MKTSIMKFLLLYVCLACTTHIYAEEVELPFITEPQSNNWSPNIRYVKVPDQTTFLCKAQAKPAAKYYWTFNGTKIVSDPKYVVVDEYTGTLTTGSRFSKDNAGDYQCYAYNDHGTAMTSVLRIYAAYYDQFKGDLKTVPKKVPISLYVKLDCTDVPESVPNWIFDWRRGPTETERDPIKFVDFSKPNERILIDKEGGIHFLWTVATDNFFYGCITTHSVFLVTLRSSTVNELIVQQGTQHERAPELKYASKEVVVYAQKDAELMCIFSYFSPTEKLVIKWLHNGEAVGSNSPNITLKAVSLPNAQRDDSGEYRCEAYLGTKTAFGTVNLKIVSPPTFLPGKSLGSNSFPVGKDAVFQCGTSSYKTYSFPTVWFVNGEPLIGCPEREFECKTPLPNGYSRCIPKEKVCDGSPDCPDGEEDEVGCPVACPESQVSCLGQCIPSTSICQECVYPSFLCHNKMKCVQASFVCNGNRDCSDGSDEIACPNGPDVRRGEYIIKSDRSQLVLQNLTLDQSRCFQCMSRNEYGTTIGDGCLTVIDKITVINGPNSTYYVEPGSRIGITLEVTTDPKWENQMHYTWTWYEQIVDENTGETTTVSKYLPTKDKAFPGVFTMTQENRTIAFLFPEVRKGEEKEQENASLFNQLINRLYTVNIEHRYDKVQINFTINGKRIVPPPVPIVEAASTNLWFIALILGILLLFIIVALIICYMYRNRGGTYLLDKKEVKAGHDPEKELNNGFQDVGRIDDDNDDPDIEKISLSESVKNYYDSDDDPTGEYEGDLDTSKFNEEGSFIGLYGAKTAKEATV